MHTNPKKGPFHERFPSKLFWRCVRGMLPHKQPRGASALGRLKCFEGIPYPYSEQKRQVVPEALKYLRIQQNRKFCVLGDLCHLIGWKYQDLVNRLEEKRKKKSSLWYQNKQAKLKKKKAADSTGDSKKIVAQLAKFGY